MIETSLFQTPPPQDLITLQWIIITVLASAVFYLFRQNSKKDDSNKETQTELLEKTLTGLGEASEAINGLANAIEAMQQQFSLKQEIDKLREELHEKNS